MNQNSFGNPQQPAQPQFQSAPAQPAPSAPQQFQSDANLDTMFTDAANQTQPQPQQQPQAPAYQPPAQPQQPQYQPPTAPQPQWGQQQPVAPQQPEFQQPAPQQPQTHPVIEQARQLGIQVPDNATIDSVAAAVLERYQQIQPYAQYGQSIMPHAAEINAALARQAMPQQPQAPEAPADPTSEIDAYFRQQWNAPAWDQQYTIAVENGLVQRDADTGMYVAAPGAEAMVAGILPGLNNAYRQQTQQWQGLMRGNPYQTFYQKLEEPLKRQWQRDIQETVQRELERHQTCRQQLEMLDSFERENGNWMFTQDPHGNRVNTPQGEQFMGAVQYLLDGGMTDNARILQTARQMIGVQPGAPQAPAPNGQPETVPFQQQAQPGQPLAQGQQPQSYMQQQPAYQQPSPDTLSQQQQQTFLQSARDRAAHQPQSGAFTVQSPENPGTVTPGELESMFVNSFRASQGQPAA